jgi:hypothetical protein
MKPRFVLAACLLAAAPAWAVEPEVLVANTWQAARTPDDERTYIRFLPMSKAEIVSEYNFQLPGQPGKRRGRATAFAKWTLKGDEVTVSYAGIRDRLRYSDKVSLAPVGVQGSAPGLTPVGEPAEKSRLRATLWKAPHDYKLKAPETAGEAKPAAEPAALAPQPPEK